MLAALYVVAVLVVAFIVSGVLPRYFEAAQRLKRVATFRDQYKAWSDADREGWPDGDDLIGTAVPAEVTDQWNEASERANGLRPWLVARRDEMQRDAQAVGRGIVQIAPAPAIGGPIRSHPYFGDLFDEQTYSEVTGGGPFKLDELATILHETECQVARRKRDVYNPWSWLRLAFERIVRFPRYVLHVAGFGTAVTDSTGVRAVSALWSFAVGAATIAGFAYAVASRG